MPMTINIHVFRDTALSSVAGWTLSRGRPEGNGFTCVFSAPCGGGYNHTTPSSRSRPAFSCGVETGRIAWVGVVLRVRLGATRDRRSSNARRTASTEVLAVAWSLSPRQMPMRPLEGEKMEATMPSSAGERQQLSPRWF